MIATLKLIMIFTSVPTDTPGNRGVNFSVSVSKYGGYTGEEVQTADTDYGNFISAVENELDEEYDSHKEQLRLKMIELGYMLPNNWDDLKKEILAAAEEG